MRLTNLKAIFCMLAIVFVSMLGVLLERFHVSDFIVVIAFLIFVLVPATIYYFSSETMFDRLFLLQRVHGHNFIVDDRYNDEVENEVISLGLTMDSQKIKRKNLGEDEHEDEIISLKLTDDK